MAHLHLYCKKEEKKGKPNDISFQQSLACVSQSLFADDRKIHVCNMKFPLKSLRHLMLVWATSGVSCRPPPRFLWSPVQLVPSLCSLRLWRATKRPTVAPPPPRFPVSRLRFTRWQSSPQCLAAAGIPSKRGLPRDLSAWRSGYLQRGHLKLYVFSTWPRLV